MQSFFNVFIFVITCINGNKQNEHFKSKEVEYQLLSTEGSIPYLRLPWEIM